MTRASPISFPRPSFPRLARIALGIVFWVLFLGWTGQMMLAPSHPEEGNEGKSTFAALSSHFRRQEIEVDVRFPYPVLLEVGDGVLIEKRDLDVRERIGEVSSLLDEDGHVLPDALLTVPGARIRLFDRGYPGLHEDARVVYSLVPDLSAGWVYRVLISEDKERVIGDIVNRSLVPYQETLLHMLGPIATNVIVDVQEVVGAAARPFLERHRPAIDRLAARVEKEIGRDRLLTFFESDIWPQLKTRLDPILDKIGDELWEKFPLWGLSWRIVYQSLPLTADDHFDRAWDRFLSKEVVPILKSHSKEVADAIRLVARDTVENPEIGPVIREAILQLVSDRDFSRLLTAFVKEVFLDNPEFHAAMERRWRSPEVRKTIGFISDRLEIATREVADLLLGTRETGISPEFARVLRAQILKKDARHILVDPGDAKRPMLKAGSIMEARVESQ